LKEGVSKCRKADEGTVKSQLNSIPFKSAWERDRKRLLSNCLCLQKQQDS
jgi:hypothetical protein